MADGDAPPPGVPGCGPAKLGILVLDDKNCGTTAVNGGTTSLIKTGISTGNSGGSCW